METVFTAVAAFISTNLDDLLVGMFCFAAAKDRRQKGFVVLGKYLGLGILVGVSLLGAAGLRLLPWDMLWLLGLIPMILGVRALFDKEKDPEAGLTGVIPVTMLTIGNGADNIGIYLPLFSEINGGRMLLTLLLFGLLNGVWCLLSERMISWERVQKGIKKHRRWLIPTVYLLLGGWILLKGWI